MMNNILLFHLDTLGCAKNEYDSEVMDSILTQNGFERTANPEEADVLIVNTCGFIDPAKEESIEHIFDMARIKGETKKLVVTGCLSERYHGDLLNDIPEVDVFLGVNDYESLPSIIRNSFIDDASRDYVVSKKEKELPYRDRIIRSNVYSSVLKIAEGCNNTCSFCAIPKIRGPYVSMRMENVIKAAKELANQGVKELIIIAQDTSYYGVDLYGKPMLPSLLNQLCEIDGIRWIRLMYVYDDGITDELIDVIANQPKVCNYIDIPIQHISNNVLGLMRRKSTKESILSTIKKLRDRVPNIHIRTTLLVGFPGETNEDFEELLSFVRDVKIERLGAFSFSDEEGTLANTMDNKLSEDIKTERLNMIMTAQAEISEAVNLKKVGKTYEVIIDEFDGEYAIARTQFDSPEIDNEVSFKMIKEHQKGDFANVLIEEAFEYDLVGREV